MIVFVNNMAYGKSDFDEMRNYLRKQPFQMIYRIGINILNLN